VIAETEHFDFDERFLNEVTAEELAGHEDGLISPVNLQIFALMIAGQRTEKERAFNRSTYQKLGGIEGLLEKISDPDPGSSGDKIKARIPQSRFC